MTTPKCVHSQSWECPFLCGHSVHVPGGLLRVQPLQASGVACLNVAILQRETTVTLRPAPEVLEILSAQAQAPLPHSVCSVVAGITPGSCFLQGSEILWR